MSDFFGPICLVFFLTMAGLGIRHIADDLTIFEALNPWHGVRFLFNHGSASSDR